MRLPILPHLPDGGIFERRQMPLRIVHYNETASSLYLRQPRQSLNLGKTIHRRKNGRLVWMCL